MMEYSRLVFSGSGGQGVITAAIILAKAASLFENKQAVQSQSYGAAARGGSTRTDVIIADSEIFFPKVIQPDILVSLTQQSLGKYGPIIRPGGILLVDSRYISVGRHVDARKISLPMYDTVMEKIGKPIVFNICMLGALIGITRIVKPESVTAVLETTIPENFMDINKYALELGLAMGEHHQI